MSFPTFASILTACVLSAWLGPTLLILIWLLGGEEVEPGFVPVVWFIGLFVGVIVSTLHSLLILPLFRWLGQHAVVDPGESRADLFARWLFGHQASVLPLVLLLLCNLGSGGWQAAMLPFLLAAQAQAAMVLWLWVGRLKAAPA